MIRNCSAVLRSHRNTLGHSIPSIRRDITDQILSWLQSDVEDNVAVLLDAAGMGKSVVLRAVLEELERNNIPVLAIKADKQLSGVTNHDDIQKSLDLPDRVENVVFRLTVSQSMVILIDQIDALSLSMARDQRALDTTLEMIARLRRIPRARLLLSCRAFDLHTDPRLSSIEIKQTFSLSGFTDEQVQAVVQKVGAQFDALSPATRKLLSIPLHLDLFVMAFEGQHRDAALPTGGLHTLQELYQLLWDNVVLRRDVRIATSLRVQAIRRITERMNQEQKTSAAHSLFTVPATEVLLPAVEYLASVGILVRGSGEWSFLHQTFFDYCYARFFVEDGRNLSQEVLQSAQGLFERPQLQHVLSYLRSTNHGAYIREFTTLFEATHLRVHLRELLREWFGALYAPSDEEWLIARQLLADEKKRPMFLRVASGNPGWFQRLHEDYLPDLLAQEEPVVSNEVFPYLWTLVNNPTCQAVILQAIKPFLNKSTEWDNRVANIIVQIQQWHTPEAVEVYEQLLVKYFSHGTMLNLLLTNLAKFSPTNALRIIRQLLDRSLNVYHSALRNYEEEKLKASRKSPSETSTEETYDGLRDYVLYSRNRPEPFDELDNSGTGGLRIRDETLKAVLEVDPVAFLNTLLPYVKQVLPLTKYSASEESGHYCSDVFSDVWSLRTKRGVMRRHDFGSALLDALRQALLTVAKEYPMEFQRISAILATFPFETPQRLLLDIYRSQPEKYAEDAWRFLITDNRRLELGEEQFESRRLIYDIIPYLTPEQRLQLEERVLSHWRLPHYLKRRYRDLRMLEENGIEQWRLLRAIGSEYLSETGRKRLREWNDKFRERELLDTPITGWSGFVGSPIDSTATTKMSDAAWIKAMAHYRRGMHHKNRGSLRGGSDQLARHNLQPQVIAHPERFHRLAMTQMPLDVEEYYIEAIIEGLAESPASSELLFDVVRRFANHPGREVKRTIARALEKRVSEALPDDVLDLLETWVRSPTPPEEDELFHTRKLEETHAQRGEDDERFAYNDPLNSGPFMDYLNSSRGKAFSTLMSGLTTRNSEEDKKRFWMLVEAMVNEPSNALRVGAVNELIPLIVDDGERTIRVFEQLMEGHALLLKTDPVHQFLNYGLYHFGERVRPFIRAIMNDSYQNVAQQGAALACVFALRHDDQIDTDLLDEIISGPASWRRGAADVFANSITHKLPDIVREACISGMIRLLDDEDDKVRRNLAQVFFSLRSEHIFSLSQFIEAFVASRSYGEVAHECNEFLWKHGELRPDWSLDQIEVILANEQRGRYEQRGFGGEPLVRLTLRFYTTYTTTSAQKERAIDLFGRVMERFASDARNALGEWDRR